jgi:hypothetical protein
MIATLGMDEKRVIWVAGMKLEGIVRTCLEISSKRCEAPEPPAFAVLTVVQITYFARNCFLFFLRNIFIEMQLTYN